MKTVTIASNGNGGFTVTPSVVNLGGTHSHQIDWNNELDQQASINCDAWSAIFSNPPQSGTIVAGGGGHDAPKPPLELLPHDRRQNGAFNYTVTVGGNTVNAQFLVHP